MLLLKLFTITRQSLLEKQPKTPNAFRGETIISFIIKPSKSPFLYEVTIIR